MRRLALTVACGVALAGCAVGGHRVAVSPAPATPVPTTRPACAGTHIVWFDDEGAPCDVQAGQELAIRFRGLDAGDKDAAEALQRCDDMGGELIFLPGQTDPWQCEKVDF